MRSKIYGIRPSRENNPEHRFAFLIRSNETYSSPNGHITSVLYPNIIKLSDIPRFQYPMTMDIRVHCSCPAFLFWGTEWISGYNDYNLEPATTIPPNIRDPQRKNWLCKHLVRVSHYMSSVNFKFLFQRFHYAHTPAKDTALPMLEPAECFDSFIAALKENNTYSKEIETDIRRHLEDECLDDILVEAGIYVK